MTTLLYRLTEVDTPQRTHFFPAKDEAQAFKDRLRSLGATHRIYIKAIRVELTARGVAKVLNEYIP